MVKTDVLLRRTNIKKNISTALTARKSFHNSRQVLIVGHKTNITKKSSFTALKVKFDPIPPLAPHKDIWKHPIIYLLFLSQGGEFLTSSTCTENLAALDLNALAISGLQSFARVELCTGTQIWNFYSAAVVYNCFFVESRQAKSHRRDIIPLAVWKDRTWVTAGTFLEWRGVLC